MSPVPSCGHLLMDFQTAAEIIRNITPRAEADEFPEIGSLENV